MSTSSAGACTSSAPRQGGRALGVQSAKTAKGQRQIDLPDGLVSLLADHERDGELVFTNFSGEPFCQRALVEHHFKPALKRGELPRTCGSTICGIRMLRCSYLPAYTLRS